MPFDRMIMMIDSFGTPDLAVLGMQLAISMHVPVPGVLLVGVANGVGGSLLRDIVVRDVPAILSLGSTLSRCWCWPVHSLWRLFIMTLGILPPTG